MSLQEKNSLNWFLFFLSLHARPSVFGENVEEEVRRHANTFFLSQVTLICTVAITLQWANFLPSVSL